LCGGAPGRRDPSVDLTKLDHPEQVAVLWSTGSRVAFLAAHHRGAFAAVGGGTPNGLLRRLLREELLLRAPIRERVEEVVRGFGGETTIGVHVRFSDRRIDLVAIRRRLETLLRRVPDAQVFLSTDNAEVKALFEGAYRRVITAPHWYPPPGAASHRHRDSPGRYAVGLQALVDLYTLADCDYLIGDASSSFARLAVLCSKASSSRITYVNRGTELRRRVHDTLERLSPRLAYEAASAYERMIERDRYLDPSPLRGWPNVRGPVSRLRRHASPDPRPPA
jgi:hypothetical protein